MQEHEVSILEKGMSGTEKYVIPINWACSLVMNMKQANKIGSETLVSLIYKVNILSLIFVNNYVEGNR